LIYAHQIVFELECIFFIVVDCKLHYQFDKNQCSIYGVSMDYLWSIYGVYTGEPK